MFVLNMTATDHRSQQLSDMADCAYRLGMAFGAAVEPGQGTDQWLAHFNAFDRCFFAVRVATALQLRLGHAPAEPHEAASDHEQLIERSDRPEAEDRDRGERDYDRDRETEHASLPILLRTLEGVAADAAALPGPEPAELPTLRELLAHAKAEPGLAWAAPRSSQGLRARLTTSCPATAPPPTPLPASPRPASPRPASNVGQVLAARHATGPPRR
jgi:hypothetical protein